MSNEREIRERLQEELAATKKHPGELFISPGSAELAIDEIDRLRAEVERLEAIVERLPMTADGVPIHLGMKIHWRSANPNTATVGRTLVRFEVDADDLEDDLVGWDETGLAIPFYAPCYSSHAALEAAERDTAPIVKCDDLNHAPADQHLHTKRCPVKDRWDRAIEAAEDAGEDEA